MIQTSLTNAPNKPELGPATKSGVKGPLITNLTQQTDTDLIHLLASARADQMLSYLSVQSYQLLFSPTEYRDLAHSWQSTVALFPMQQQTNRLPVLPKNAMPTSLNMFVMSFFPIPTIAEIII